MNPEVLKECPPEELADAIGQMHGVYACSHKTLLDLISTYDESEAWKEDGAVSIEVWLCCTLGIAFSLASEWVLVARSFRSLPKLAQAYEEGRLPYGHVKSLIKVATSDNEVELLERAIGMNAWQVQRMVKYLSPPAPEEDKEKISKRSLNFQADREEGFTRFWGRLPEADGATVETALRHIAEKANKKGVTDGLEALMADALVELSSSYLGEEAEAARPLLVVHVENDTLLGKNNWPAEIEGGPLISAIATRRLACDCLLQVAVHGPDGLILGVGRQTRQVPRWLRRQLMHRDKGCRFPGCDRKRWLHAHHIVPWELGGPTNLDNLVMLCTAHHRFVHELEWELKGKPDEEMKFLKPGGQILKTGPPPLRPEVRQRVPDSLFAFG
jgi:hypothetical protein